MTRRARDVRAALRRVRWANLGRLAAVLAAGLLAVAWLRGGSQEGPRVEVPPPQRPPAAVEPHPQIEAQRPPAPRAEPRRSRRLGRPRRPPRASARRSGGRERAPRPSAPPPANPPRAKPQLAPGSGEFTPDPGP